MILNLAAKWEAAIAECWDATNERAVRYKQGIAAELSRPKPRLITDKAVASEETTLHHITLLSLDHWARITCSHGILDQEAQDQIANLPAAPKRARVKGLERNRPSLKPSNNLASTRKSCLRDCQEKPG